MHPHEIARREVAWNPVTGLLTVGGATVRVDRSAGNEGLLRRYLELVAEQRDVTLHGGIALRRDDIVVLAELLDLDDADLERQLRDILRLTDHEAAELRRRLLRQKVGAAAVGVGMLAAGVPLGTAVSDLLHRPDDGHRVTTEAPAVVAPGAPVTVTVPAGTGTAAVTVAPPAGAEPVVGEVGDPIGDPVGDPIADPVGRPVAAEDPAGAGATDRAGAGAGVAALGAAGDPAAPAAGDASVDVGSTVVHERDPDFVPPPGVDIGDALVVERDAPPPADG